MPASRSSAAEAEGGKPREIPLDQIDRNPFQTRSQMNEEQLAELAASITANGVVQPILVRPLANGRFQLIAGERRWRASQLAGKTTIPAILRQVSDEQAMEITIVENLQRADLNPMEQARAFDRLSREFHMTQEQMAVRTGKDRATVANFLRLLRLAGLRAGPRRVRRAELWPRAHSAGLRARRGDRKGGAAHRRTFAFCSPDRELCAGPAASRKRRQKGSQSRSRPSTPTSAKFRSVCSAPSGSRSTSKTTTAAAKSSSNTRKLEDFDTLLEQLAGE